MKKHGTVEQIDDDHLINDWRDEVAIDDKYEQQRPYSFKVLEEVANM